MSARPFGAGPWRRLPLASCPNRQPHKRHRWDMNAAGTMPETGLCEGRPEPAAVVKSAEGPASGSSVAGASEAMKRMALAAKLRLLAGAQPLDGGFRQDLYEAADIVEDRT